MPGIVPSLSLFLYSAAGESCCCGLSIHRLPIPPLREYPLTEIFGQWLVDVDLWAEDLE